jgi:hypothetical protein
MIKSKIEELLEQPPSNNNSEFGSIRCSRATIRKLESRGCYKDTHEKILLRLLDQTDNKLQPSSSDGGSF